MHMIDYQKITGSGVELIFSNGNCLAADISAPGRSDSFELTSFFENPSFPSITPIKQKHLPIDGRSQCQ